jgi:hypothetical protein
MYNKTDDQQLKESIINNKKIPLLFRRISMTRRSFLISLLSLFLPLNKVFSQSRHKITDEVILKRLLDVIIPSDDTVGAKEANLYDKLISLISEDKRRKKYYDKELLMIRKSIESIPTEKIDWNNVAKQISQSSFFRVLRRDAIHLFYSDHIGWRTINYDGPPLAGYRDYNKC